MSSHLSGSFESSYTQFYSPGFCLASPANPRSPAYENKIRRSLRFKIYSAAAVHFGWVLQVGKQTAIKLLKY